MFSFPVTVPVHTPDEIYPIYVSVDVDKVAVVKPLLDKSTQTDVDSAEQLLPASEIVLVDGRKLLVVESPAAINRYLDAYRVLEGFYTGRAAAVEEPVRREGNVVPLFQGGPCATSEGSTPA